MTPAKLISYSLTMMRIPVTKARLQIAELVNRVQYTGERIILTKHDKPAAMLVPIEETKEPQSDRPKRSTPRAARR